MAVVNAIVGAIVARSKILKSFAERKFNELKGSLGECFGILCDEQESALQRFDE